MRQTTTRNFHRPILGSLAFAMSLSANAASLPSYNVDIKQTSVSGLSAGGFMAVQFHVAYSSIVKGVGVFAGGPFYCSEGQLGNAVGKCMAATSTYYMPSAQTAIDYINNWSSAGTIDNKSNLANSKVFLFGGAKDTTVYPLVMDAAHDVYKSFVSSGNIMTKLRYSGAAHLQPTVNYGGDCATTQTPWMGKCSYDGAGEALKWIYGGLNAAATTLGGSYISFDQSEFLSNPDSHSVAATGYAYVPASCKSGASCKAHVVFHGCKQYAGGSVGDKFYKNAGYNEWADTNNIIVLYPQTVNKNSSPTNPNGCWDWWGYDDANYSKKSGNQMVMVKKMLDRLAAGYSGGTTTTTTSASTSSTTAQTTTTTTAATSTTTSTTTTTTAGKCYSQSISATCATHYVAKRLALSQYTSCGSKIGYTSSVMLYGYGSGSTTWTNKSNCSALAF